mmetsp:Transcript_31839/g.74397  ORF Transcript_31839/g.74397 Transcript_31839/m.74397 type:complete len:445 (+) Transcript_31839:135-1469(+)
METLCAAPPAQWAALLQHMGATVRPAGPVDGAAGEACTISALLENVARERQESIEVLEADGEQAATTSAKQLRRRNQQRATKPTPAPWAEDTRSIEELLRDIGEVQDQKPKASVAQKKSKVQAVKAAVPSQVVVKPLSPTKPAGESKASKQEAPMSPSLSTASTSTDGGASAEDGREATVWTSVTTKSAKRKQKQKTAEEQVQTAAAEASSGSSLSKHEEEEEDERPAASEEEQASHASPAAEKQVQEVTVTEEQEQPEEAAVQEAICLEGLASSADAPKLFLEKEVQQEFGSSYRRCLSVGDEPRGLLPAAAIPQSGISFHGRPSVGTWLGQASPASRREAASPARGAAALAAATAAEEARETPDEEPFCIRPSVGTWLVPKQEPFWPPTPECSPRHSSLGSSGDAAGAAAGSPVVEPMVMVAVPLSLLPAVQQLLQSQQRPA